MWIKFSLTFLIGLLTILLGIHILKKNSASNANRSYLFLCLAGGGWALAMAFQAIVADVFIQQFIVNIFLYIFALLAPLAYLLVAYNFPYQLKPFNKTILFFVYLIPVLFILLEITTLIKMENISLVNGLIYHQVNFWPFLLFTVYFFLYIIWGAIILIKKQHPITGVLKTQIQYLLIGTLTTFITIGTVSIFLPLVINSFLLDWLGPLFLLIHLAVLGDLLFVKKYN